MGLGSLPEPGGSCAAVAAELRRFGAELAESAAAQTGDRFTYPAADALIKSSPTAFLLGVLFTQGIPAARAWAGPYELQQRLGHLDLRRLAAEPQRVAEAVAAPPALHRFVRTLPGWICSAAARIERDHGGDAARIWEAGSDVTQVTERLLAFDGIGPKKAAMTVGILMRHFGVELSGRERSTVAYDVQVRRVFLRSGLIDQDTPQAVQAAAAAACPSEPALLDLPAWTIGRETCRPRHPGCERCRLGAVCPRLTQRDARGVGVRRASA